MTVECKQVGWKFWLLWVLASILGWGVSVSLALSLMDVYARIGPFRYSGESAIYAALFMWVLSVLIVAWGGILSGLLQWLVLRRQVARVGRWLIASTVGWAMGSMVGSLLWTLWVLVGTMLGLARAPVGLISVPVVAGAVGGAMQWLLLRQQVRRAGWWVLASVLGWGVGLAAGYAVIRDGWPVGGYVTMAVGGAAGGTVVGAVGGAITGIVLVWLLRQPLAPGLEAARE